MPAYIKKVQCMHYTYTTSSKMQDCKEKEEEKENEKKRFMTRRRDCYLSGGDH